MYGVLGIVFGGLGVSHHTMLSLVSFRLFGELVCKAFYVSVLPCELQSKGHRFFVDDSTEEFIYNADLEQDLRRWWSECFKGKRKGGSEEDGRR